MTAAGTVTTAWATASRAVIGLAEISTIRGWLVAGSR